MTARAWVLVVIVTVLAVGALAHRGAVQHEQAVSACQHDHGHWSTDLDECIQ